MIYSFGLYELDTHLRELRCAGQPFAVQPRAFQVLAYLVQHRDRVVTRQELLDKFWSTGFIDRTVVARSIMTARKAIADDGDNPKYIQTVRGHGYRFVAAVAEREDVRSDRRSHVHPSARRSPAILLRDAMPTASSSSPTPPDIREQRVRGALVEERKLVTVLCGVMAPTARLIGGLGPEAILSMQQEVFALALHEVHGYEGWLQPAIGDRFLALFGAPIAQEDHVQRAVLVALRLRQRLQQRGANAELPEARILEVGIGLHTGLVAMTESESDQPPSAWSLGDTTALATYLAQWAEPGTILASEITARLVQHEVQCEVIRPERGSGYPVPHPVYRIVGRKRQTAGAPLRRHWPLSRFVGREREVETLRALLAQVVSGRGQVIAIVGEPGIGKSRLLAEFRRRVADDTCTYLSSCCRSYGQATPYLPLSDLVRQLFGLTEANPPNELLARVYQGLQDMSIEAEGSAPYLLHLLGRSDAVQTLGELTPEALRKRTFAALHTLFLNHGQHCPLIIEVEDLHWIDATSEAYLTELIERLAGVPLLLLVSYRPDYQPFWQSVSYLTRRALQPLTAIDCQRLLQSALHVTSLATSIQRQIVTKAQGNPLFLEELVQVAQEQRGSVPTLAVPDTLQAVLAARIDRLAPEAKRLLQTVAVVGTDVSESLLHALTPLPEETLRARLRDLQDMEFLYETWLLPESTYAFKHILMQEVAYQSLLRRTRQQLHAQVAHVLIEQFPAQTENQPERLAHHYTEAGRTPQAIDYWQRAGQRAVQRSAHVEAVTHFTKGLECLRTLPDTPARNQQELAFYTALGPELMAIKGYAAPEVEHTYARARVLCQQVGDTPELFSALYGLWQFYALRGTTQTTSELEAHLLQLAHGSQDSAFSSPAYRVLGTSLFMQGEFCAAREYLERSIAASAPQRDRTQAMLYGTDPGVMAGCFAANTLWALGYSDQAWQRSREAFERAQAIAHPLSQAHALALAAELHRFRREVTAVLAQAKAAVAIAADQEFVHIVSLGKLLQAWAMAAQGQGEAALAQMQHALTMRRTTGAGRQPHIAGLIAEIYWYGSQPAEGLRVLDTALGQGSQVGPHWYTAELYRLKGELLLAQPEHEYLDVIEDVTASLRQALVIARHQQAKSLELRAAMSLSRFWQRQGEYREARDVLSEIYNWFTEGFNTPDLKEAKALVESLA